MTDPENSRSPPASQSLSLAPDQIASNGKSSICPDRANLEPALRRGTIEVTPAAGLFRHC